MELTENEAKNQFLTQGKQGPDKLEAALMAERMQDGRQYSAKHADVLGVSMGSCDKEKGRIDKTNAFCAIVGSLGLPRGSN